jgi:hypothetical protein
LPFVPSIAIALLAAGCSWRQEHERARPEASRGALAADLARVDELRAKQDLEAAAILARALAAEHPDDARALFAASRAESDTVVLSAGQDREVRDAAASSAFDYSKRSIEAGADWVDALAQHAWAMGTSTHLQPMFDRSDHAWKTLEAIDRALEKDPRNAVALATKSILRLRLATLPWIARVMASGAPEGSVDEAVALAEASVASVPSVENRLILAKALLAAERSADARRVLEETLEQPDRFPRDHELREAAKKLLEEMV